MKKLVTVQVFCALTMFGQNVPPNHPVPKPPVHEGPPAPPFTQLENVVAKDIQQKQIELQQEINDFMAEVRTAHPGFFFSNGSLEPIPAPPKAADKPPAKEEKK